MLVAPGVDWKTAPEGLADSFLQVFKQFKVLGDLRSIAGLAESVDFQDHLFIWKYDGSPLGNKSGNVVFLEPGLSVFPILSTLSPLLLSHHFHHSHDSRLQIIPE